LFYDHIDNSCMLGNCKINVEEMIEDTKTDLDTLTCKMLNIESQCLQFAGIQYHYSGQKYEEIVPSSNSNSDSEIYNGKIALSDYKFSPALNNRFLTLAECFSSQPKPKCCILLLENINANVCNSTYSCWLLEPLISADELQPIIPPLDSLLKKLNVFNIPDPTDIVESTVNSLFEKERNLLYCDDASHVNSTTSICEEIMLKSYPFQALELDNEILALPSSPIKTLTCALPFELKELQADEVVSIILYSIIVSIKTCFQFNIMEQWVLLLFIYFLICLIFLELWPNVLSFLKGSVCCYS